MLCLLAAVAGRVGAPKLTLALGAGSLKYATDYS